MPLTITEPPISIYRLSIQQYHRMIETAVLTEDDPIELLEGWMVTKMPQNPRHATTITRTLMNLESKLPSDLIVRVQQPMTTRDSEPEPDLAVVSAPLGKVRRPSPDPF